MMPSLSPHFGSLFILKTLRNREDYPNPQQCFETWNGVSRATSQIKKPATMTIVSGGCSLDYPVTLPGGQEKRIVAKSDEKSSVVHILSGISQGTNNPIDRSFPKSLSGRLANWYRQRVLKQPPLTVEQASDEQVERILKANNVAFKKVAFEDWTPEFEK